MLSRGRVVFKEGNHMKNAPQQDSQPISTPVMGTPAGAVNYSQHGLPQEISKTGDGMSQNDYENLRKVL
mgnify:CR=1 FL=1